MKICQAAASLESSECYQKYGKDLTALKSCLRNARVKYAICARKACPEQIVASESELPEARATSYCGQECYGCPGPDCQNTACYMDREWICLYCIDYICQECRGYDCTLGEEDEGYDDFCAAEFCGTGGCHPYCVERDKGETQQQPPAAAPEPQPLPDPEPAQAR